MTGRKPAATHYAVKLAKSFTIPGTDVVIRAGDSVLSAEIVKMIPTESILSKEPAEA